jgi:hypothetical protein
LPDSRTNKDTAFRHTPGGGCQKTGSSFVRYGLAWVNGIRTFESQHDVCIRTIRTLSRRSKNASSLNNVVPPEMKAPLLRMTDSSG